MMETVKGFGRLSRTPVTVGLGECVCVCFSLLFPLLQLIHRQIKMSFFFSKHQFKAHDSGMMFLCVEEIKGETRI